MKNKKYTVTCEGKEIEVSEEVYRLCVTEPESERRLIRLKKFGKIDVDAENEKVSFILCREDSVDRLLEIGVELVDPNDVIEASEVSIMVKQALDILTDKERYIIDSLFFHGKTERDLAKKLNWTQNKVNYHKDRILVKMNKFLRKFKKS